MKNWPIRTRLAVWTAFFLTFELIIFSVASGSVIYNNQLEAFREIEEKPSSPIVITEETNELLSELATAYLAALPLAALVAALGVWLITRKALRPLQDVADAAEQIHSKALHQRLPQPPGEDEVGRLVRVLNDTFNRLERSFAQTTRFSSDASHELKTPLTIMRGEIESALRSQLKYPEIEKLLVDLLNQTQRLSSITEKLLLLSRADAGALVLKKEAVEFSAMCRDLVEDAEILGLRRKITTQADISPGVIVCADQSYLRQALLNLLDNAIKYNFESGNISISLTKSNSLALFRIVNTGKEISKENETSVFERFYRDDPSRTAEVEGSGLGLSICREIALAHEGQIWLEGLEPHRTTFILALPLSQKVSASGRIETSDK